MRTNHYAQALNTGRASDTLAETVGGLGNQEITRADDAESIAEFLEREREWLVEPTAPPSRLHVILGLFQQVDSEEAFSVLHSRGLPVLREIHDRWIARDDWDEGRADDLLFLIKIFALYADEDDLPRIARAARDDKLCDEYLWTPVLAVYHAEHPLYHTIFEELADPLPNGFAGVCLLDAANQRAREGSDPHPFNSPAGHARLESYLRNSGEDSSYAHSAAAALPFLDDPPRGQLLALGLDHSDERVQLESAWASASLGSRAGVDFLARACLDWRVSSIAVEYLTEIGELNAIPARARDPEFTALSEMARWLSHPMEFGRPPDEVAVHDRRTLIWPPAGESRNLWMIRYRYRGEEAADEGEVGVGLVGNITFSLFGETDPTMSPEEIYALHCCWEMEVEEHQDAPPERTIAAGREILRRAGNPGF